MEVKPIIKICAKCGAETNKFAWVKRFVEVMTDFDTDDLEAVLGYGRREFLKIVKDDVENNKNKGESFYCMICFRKI